jgi:hypothetical protein
LGIARWVVTKVVGDIFYLISGRDLYTCTWDDQGIQPIYHGEDEYELYAKYDVKSIVLFLYCMEVKFFDIENE